MAIYQVSFSSIFARIKPWKIPRLKVLEFNLKFVKKSYGESQIIIKKSAIWDFVFKKVGESGVMCEYC